MYNVILQLATCSPLGGFPNWKKKFLFGCPFQLSEWQNKWPENCVPHLHCIQLCTWHHRSSKRDRITRRFFESFMSFYSSQDPLPLFPYSSVNSFSERKSLKNNMKLKCFCPLCKRLNDEYTEISHIFCVSKMALKWTMRCMWLHQLFPFFGSWFMDPPKEHPKYPKMPKMSILDFCWKVFY